MESERTNSMKLQEQVQSLDRSLYEYAERAEQQQQTISLLVSEKASLSASVERLEGAEAGMSYFVYHIRAASDSVDVSSERDRNPASGRAFAQCEASSARLSI